MAARHKQRFHTRDPDMKLNRNGTIAMLALLTSGSTPWGCESSDTPERHRAGVQPLKGNVLEPWYETCADIGAGMPRAAHDHVAAKQAGATGTFVVPSTVDYAWVAIGHARAPDCGTAKLYLDARYVETIDLRASGAPQKCERVYYLEDHTKLEHRFEVVIEGASRSGNDGYACLDYVVVGW